MVQKYKNIPLRQAGFSLVEILVGLVIGLLATLVIMQVFSVFEGQKRSTSGSADAQTNGSIALMNIQRDLQMAGYGLPPLMIEVGLDNFSSLLCDPSPVYDHDGNPATPNLGLSPIVIQDGPANANDVVTVRYSTNASMGGIPINISSTLNATAPLGLAVLNNIGCKNGDIVLISNGTASCTMTKIADANGNPDSPINISLDVNTPLVGPLAPGVTNSRLACMGNWRDHTYDIFNNELRLTDENGIQQPIVSEVVNIQAQYGVSALATSNQVNQWVNATGATWGAAMTVANRNRIKAVRIVVVVRNGLREKENVTNTCTTNKGVINNGPCAWDDTDYDAAPMIDLSTDPDWRKYRYKSFETIIPLRNMLWSRGGL